jgi:hypothetical protein
MWVNRGEVEPSGDEEEHSSHCLEADVSTRLAFGGLKQAIDARPLFERALAIIEKALGGWHPDTARARQPRGSA